MSKKTYQHGGNVLQFAKQLNCSVDEVIDLSSNINFVKPKINVDFNRLEIKHYPNYDRLKQLIANRYTVKTTQLALFNGASSAIFSLFRFMKTKHCYLFSPNYLEYKRAALMAGCQLQLLKQLDDLHEIESDAVIVITNPSSPFGHYQDLTKQLKRWHELQINVVVDESFIEFCDGESAVNRLLSMNNLFIIKSMTKYYAAAGIRLGLILSNQKNITSINKQEPVWKLSQFDSAYIKSALQDSSFVKRSKVQNQQSKDFLISILRRSPLIEKIYPSDTNFVLVKLNGISANALQEVLLPYKILIRNCHNFDFLNHQYVRFAVKAQTELIVLQQALNFDNR